MLVPVVATYASNVGTSVRTTTLESGLVCVPLLFPKLKVRNCSAVVVRVILTLTINQGVNANPLYTGLYTNVLTQFDLPANGLLERDLGASLGGPGPMGYSLSLQALSGPGGKVLTLVEGLYESLGQIVPQQLPVTF